MLADIAQGRGAEQRVTHGVTHHVGIGVADERHLCVIEVDAAQHERPAFSDRMHVVSDSISNHAAPFFKMASAMITSSR
jgi:hypothetical protein